MKKAFSWLLMLSVLLFSVAAAEIRLDYNLMTEDELLKLMKDVSEKLFDYGYTVIVQKGEGSQNVEFDVQQDDELSQLNDKTLYEYPISIRYIKVTNDRGLSTRKDCTVSFKNTSKKEMKRVYFRGTCYNRVDEYCGAVSMSCTGPFEVGAGYDIFYQADVWKDNAASRVVLTEVKIVYMDDTELVIDGSEAIERLFVRGN